MKVWTDFFLMHKLSLFKALRKIWILKLALLKTGINCTSIKTQTTVKNFSVLKKSQRREKLSNSYKAKLQDKTIYIYKFHLADESLGYIFKVAINTCFY